MNGLTIGRLARAAGVGVETVRYYQRRGLVDEPPRPPRGVRRYDAGTAERIRFVRRAQRFGFSLAEIAELLALSADADASCTDVRGRAQAKLGQVRERIADLARLEAALERLVEACPGEGDTDRCTIIETLRHDEPDMAKED